MAFSSFTKLYIIITIITRISSLLQKETWHLSHNLPTLPFLLSHSLPPGLGKHSSVFCHYDVPTVNIFIQMESYMVLCDWLLSPGMFSLFIHTVECISTFCYCQILFYCTAIK